MMMPLDPEEAKENRRSISRRLNDGTKENDELYSLSLSFSFLLSVHLFWKLKLQHDIRVPSQKEKEKIEN